MLHSHQLTQFQAISAIYSNMQHVTAAELLQALDFGHSDSTAAVLQLPVQERERGKEKESALENTVLLVVVYSFRACHILSRYRHQSCSEALA